MDGAVHGAVLLVAADRLDGLPVACMNSMKCRTTSSRCAGRSRPAISRSCSDRPGLAQALRPLRPRTARAIGADHRFPGRVVLEGGAHAAHARLVEAGGDQQLVGVRTAARCPRCRPPRRGLALVAVAAQLVHGLGQRLGHAGALALHHHQRDAVHQQHQVGHDEGLAAVEAGRAVHAVLVDDGEAVVAPGSPSRCSGSSGRARRPSRAGPRPSAAQQQLGGGLVGLHQLVRGDAGDGATASDRRASSSQGAPSGPGLSARRRSRSTLS
jgi:hypothetical protein